MKYKIDTNFFNKWSSDMAYTLGFFSGDGCLHRHLNKYWVFSINILARDKEILKFILKSMKSNHKILYQTQKKKSGKQSLMARIIIYSNELCKPLFKLGLTQRKTWNKKLPIIPEKYKVDYLRGYFDADGSISIKNKKNQYKEYVWSISCCSKRFLNKLYNIYPLGKIVKGNKTWDWKINKKQDIEKICKFLYNGHFKLKRKYLRYKQMPKFIPANLRHLKRNKNV